MPVIWPVSMRIMVLGRVTGMDGAVFEQSMAERYRSRVLKNLGRGWVVLMWYRCRVLKVSSGLSF
jgi:hypothetical protein